MAQARSARSAYRELASDLRTALLRDEFSGGRLPTEAELAQRYGVSRQTVRRAFHDLVSEGMVVRVPGRGTFAAPRDGRYLRQFGSIDDLMGLSQDTVLRVLTPLHRRIDIEAAGRLRLDSDAVVALTFLRLHDAVPFCVTTVHVPPDVGRLLRDAPELRTAGASSPVTVIGLLDRLLPHPITEAEQSITAVTADPTVAEQLGCAPGRALLRIDRLYYSGERPAELAVSHFLPEQYSYRVRLQRNVR